MLVAMAARAGKYATPGPHAATAQCLDFWPELTACRWRGAARRARGGLNGKTRAMASGGHERRDNRMHEQHGKASVWPA